jgi:hypothetical protein
MRKFGGLAGATSQPPTNAPHGARFSSLLGPHVPAWVHTCADYYAAAALYEQLYHREVIVLGELEGLSYSPRPLRRRMALLCRCYPGPIRSACGTGPP